MNALTLKQIDKNITWVRTTGSKMDDVIHATAVAILVHGQEHGDVSRAGKLLAAMPKSGRAKALKAWFETMSPIRFKDDGTSYLGGKPEARVWLIEEAQATPFWDLNPEKDIKAFDFEAMMNSLLKRYEKAVEEGKEIKDPAKAAALAARLRAVAVGGDVVEA